MRLGETWGMMDRQESCTSGRSLVVVGGGEEEFPFEVTA